MRPIQLEAIALRAITAVSRGESFEDDFVECKRDWPTEDKSRQLAGLLNRAAGEPVVYLIGIDEGSRTFPPVNNIEVSDWWRQMTSKFDQMAPELLHHMIVPFGEQGQQIVALAISSERVPYVIRTGLAKPKLEIPIRRATGTETATRDELLRLLLPTVTAPAVTELRTTLSLNRTYHQADAGLPESKYYNLYGSFRAFVEPAYGQVVTLPIHSMRARISLGDVSIDAGVESSLPNSTEIVSSAVETSDDAIAVMRPGTIRLRFTKTGVFLGSIPSFCPDENIDVTIAIPVANSARVVKTQVSCRRSSQERSSSDLTPSMTWSHGN